MEAVLSDPADKLVIINRGFWPVYPVIGEALLRLAETAVKRNQSVSVVLQDHVGIRGKLAEHDRGHGIRFFPARAWSNSGSGVLRRACDAVFFASWVLGVLLWVRPSRVYVSTDPPVAVPFLVMVYCRLFSARYTYHLQDIHPEAARVVMPVNRWLYRLLLAMDVRSMRNASRLITITEQMARKIRVRSATCAPIDVIPNPAVPFDEISFGPSKIAGFSFCGNAGRLQRIPLLIQAIGSYLDQGGRSKFVFAGGGVHSKELAALAANQANVSYLGVISSQAAAQLNADYEWALLPIEDEVTEYAFPSKSSSYVMADAKILAICGGNTSVAKWVLENDLGVAVEPDVTSLVQAFFDIESGRYVPTDDQRKREELKADLSPEVFVDALAKRLLEHG